jgi:hypothetical protein
MTGTANATGGRVVDNDDTGRFYTRACALEGADTSRPP